MFLTEHGIRTKPTPARNAYLKFGVSLQESPTAYGETRSCFRGLDELSESLSLTGCLVGDSGGTR